jgi:hypothetical protein
MNAAAAFRDPRVARLDQLARKDAQLVLCQEALRRGALTASELASGVPPRQPVRVSVRSPLWATTLATVYFTSEQPASEWAHDLLARLPHVPIPRPRASARAWQLQITAAKVTRSGVTGGPVLAILDATRPNQPATVAATANGAAAADGAAPGSIEQLASTISAALATIEPDWVIAKVARLRCPSSGNVFIELEGRDATIHAVIFASALGRVGRLPEQGQLVAAHIARVSLYRRQGRLSLVLDRLGPPDRVHGG